MAVNTGVVSGNDQTNNDCSNSAIVANHSAQSNLFILLSTATVQIKDSQGQLHNARALLDSGSQANFMSRTLFDKLKLHGQEINLPVMGTSQNEISIKLSTKATIKTIHNEYAVDLSFLILPKITDNIPSVSFDISKLKVPQNIKLADPAFNVLAYFFELLCVGQIKMADNEPILQKTRLGWILSGPIKTH
ncbi:hypothetical protein NQ315_008256 [Exocentrus adspersus]|uniref:Peptidase aspartic putative domain-containing protein n=1 Tax=Exocentrus adspersus TaxID=1586481 RepID=A0AAV8VMJ4_9CUCU|nr:hypothetical protein NQ315_008256 [Exocentrus adspersus]